MLLGRGSRAAGPSIHESALPRQPPCVHPARRPAMQTCCPVRVQRPPRMQERPPAASYWLDKPGAGNASVALYRSKVRTAHARACARMHRTHHAVHARPRRAVQRLWDPCKARHAPTHTNRSNSTWAATHSSGAWRRCGPKRAMSAASSSLPAAPTTSRRRAGASAGRCDTANRRRVPRIAHRPCCRLLCR